MEEAPHPGAWPPGPGAPRIQDRAPHRPPHGPGRASLGADPFQLIPPAVVYVEQARHHLIAITARRIASVKEVRPRLYPQLRPVAPILGQSCEVELSVRVSPSIDCLLPAPQTSDSSLSDSLPGNLPHPRCPVCRSRVMVTAMPSTGRAI